MSYKIAVSAGLVFCLAVWVRVFGAEASSNANVVINQLSKAGE